MNRINPGIAVVVSLFLILGIMIVASLSCVASSKPQVREYEDHSARITYADYICVVPAYDSPGDRIRCYKEGK